MQILYMILLKSQNIPARRVQFYDKIKYPYNGHAPVEFFYNGKWYASDPQFNIMFKSGNQYLSYAQLYDILESKNDYEVTSNGFPIIDISSKNIHKYYITLKDLMKYLVIDATKIVQNGKITTFDIILRPTGFDGHLKAKNHTIDFKTHSSLTPIYQFIYDLPKN